MNQGNLISSLSISFYCLMALAKTSSTIVILYTEEMLSTLTIEMIIVF